MLFEPGDGEVGGGHADGFLRHLRTAGCATPANPLVGANGIASPLLAPFGAHGINLAAHHGGPLHQARGA